MRPQPVPRGQNRPSPGGGGELVALVLAVVLFIPSLCCYLAGGLAALVVHGRFAAAPGKAVLAMAFQVAHHPRDPALAWPAATRALVPGPVPVYAIAVVLLGSVATVALVVIARAARRRRRAGFASDAEVRKSLSVRAVRARAPQVRPSLSARAAPSELGLGLGRELSTRRALWGSLEDSFLVLGPPRSGKGVSLVIPAVLDAPGAAVVTSTRPEVLLHTACARPGAVEVFDPQHASRWPSRLRWSPVVGCEDPLVAIRRARGFAAAVGFEKTTSDADFWAASAAAVIRAYLHAAALDGRNIRDVVSWASRPGDSEPGRILRRNPGAAPGWADDLAGQAA
ncbi:MAG TPA: type IV secretory system conjugative DNA transfer family protein, partial [Acidimicrobiales bacterium]|nr:type IV secretory system conjugative DNA transfer family protein [Acidimicrobiales bacterium]